MINNIKELINLHKDHNYNIELSDDEIKKLHHIYTMTYENQYIEDENVKDIVHHIAKQLFEKNINN